MQSLWLFPFAQPINESLVAQVQATLAEWKAHGTPVPATVSLNQGHVLAIQALDTSSGCGIDWMQKAVADVFEQNQLTVLPPTTVFYQTPGGSWQQCAYTDVPALLSAGTLSAQTPVLDLTCVHQNALQNLQTTLAQCWLNRYLVTI